MTVGFSDTQKQRLVELGVERTQRQRQFSSAKERDKGYQEIEAVAVEQQRRCLMHFRQTQRRPRLCMLENELARMLADDGFVQVTTPIIMSKSSLAKMGITEEHPLTSQVFWLGKNKCLRPMLAPHLYAVSQDLLRLWEEPVRIFEIGPCFRKESQGAKHANEFTMLNVVEFGVKESQRRKRIVELSERVLKCVGSPEYDFEVEHSEVYGDTIDIVGKPQGLELGSSAMGPHPLDRHWRITTSWVGIGFGLERLIMAVDKEANMGSVVRSLTYLDGIRLNI